MMKHVTRSLVPAAIITMSVISVMPARADDGGGPNAYVVTDLVTDPALAGPKTDPLLHNAWGITFSPGASPFWISDNATGCSTLYDGQGNKVALNIGIPLPGGTVNNPGCVPLTANATLAAPTGVVWNPTTAFLVPGTTTPSAFIWATEDGTISAWARTATPPPMMATLAVDNSAKNAVYKGLVFGTNSKGVFLFAANFREATIDVFDSTFKLASTTGGFKDPSIPPGYAPFDIQNVGGDLFVTYAQQDSAKHDDVAGQGHGFVNIFDTDGNLLKHFARRGQLNSPWGVARASFNFGRFSSDILIGNFGDGTINAFDEDGHFVGTLKDGHGKPIVIDGLWALTQGGGAKSSPDTIYFTAGPNDETDGRFGTITPQGNH